MYTQLQLREIFHIEFLRQLAVELPPNAWVLKGGVNLRLFFHSLRYSEDMDIDVGMLPVVSVQKRVMRILSSPAFKATLRTYGITGLTPPDMAAAKQTAVTQRFKVHLLTADGGDYFTKVEFSRRGFSGEAAAESVPAAVLRPYAMAPLIVRHYPAGQAAAQKMTAVLSRSTPQARDVFDLYLLSTQVKPPEAPAALPGEGPGPVKEVILGTGFELFRDSVAEYLAPEAAGIYASPEAWDEVKLKAAAFVEELYAARG